MPNYRVEKQDFSRGAWRVLFADGTQVLEERSHDFGDAGKMSFRHPVCFDRRRDALLWISEHEVEQ